MFVFRVLPLLAFVGALGVGSAVLAQSQPVKLPPKPVAEAESEAALSDELTAQAALSIQRGMDLVDQDRFAEADPHYRNAAAIAVDGLGADHPTSLTLTSLVAVNLIALGRLEEALAILEPVQVGLAAHYGPDSVEVNRIRVVMAQAYLRTDDPLRAAPLMERVIEHEGPGAPRYVINLVTMGQLLNRAGRHAEAEVWLRRALEREGAMGVEPLSIGAAKSHLSESLRRQGRYDEAETMMRGAIAALGDRRALSPTEIERYWVLAQIIEEDGRPADSVGSYRRAMAAIVERHGMRMGDQTRLGERRVFAPMFAGFVTSAWFASTDDTPTTGRVEPPSL